VTLGARIAAFALHTEDEPVPVASSRRASRWAQRIAACAEHVLHAWPGTPSSLSVVIATQYGDGAAVHAMVSAAAGAPDSLSPTQFLKAINVIAAGQLSARLGSHRAATVINAGPHSLAAGLGEALTQCVADETSVLLLFAECAVPPPLASLTAHVAEVGVALLLVPQPSIASDALAGLVQACLGAQGRTPESGPLTVAQLKAILAASPPTEHVLCLPLPNTAAVVGMDPNAGPTIPGAVGSDRSACRVGNVVVQGHDHGRSSTAAMSVRHPDPEAGVPWT